MGEQPVEFRLQLTPEKSIPFSGAILKYINQFQDVYTDFGLTTFEQDANFTLPEPFWRLAFTLLTEHAQQYPDIEEGEDSREIPLEPSNQALISRLPLTALYRMLRAFDFYDSVLMRDLLMKELVRQTLPLTLQELTQMHSGWQPLDKTEVPEVSPLEMIAGDYSLFRANLLNLFRRQLGTFDLVRIIDNYLPRVTSILAGSGSHFSAVREDATLWQLKEEELEWTQVPIRDVISVWNCYSKTLILTKKGMYGMGSIVGDDENLELPRLIDLPQTLNAACSAGHAMFVTTGGVYAIGLNENGQLGTGTREPSFEPVLVAIEDRTVRVACGREFSLLLSEQGSVYYCGEPIDGVLPNNARSPDLLNPRQLALPNGAGKIVSVATDGDHALLINTAGHVYGFGNNTYGQLALGHTRSVEAISLCVIRDVKRAVASSCCSLFIKTDGALYFAGLNADRFFPDQPLQISTPIYITNNVVTAAIGLDKVIKLLKCDGQLYTLTRTGLVKDAITIARMPICPSTPPVNGEAELSSKLRCHYCGKHDSDKLAFSKQTKRIFCTPCFSHYKQFRVPVLGM